MVGNEDVAPDRSYPGVEQPPGRWRADLRHVVPCLSPRVENDGLERLVDAIRPGLVEHVWAEPYNDRFNWQGVYEACPAGGPDRQLLSEVYGEKNDAAWSHYATGLYTRLHRKAEDEGWTDKLRYLLYEDKIVPEDAHNFDGLAGVLLQSKPDEETA